MGLKKKIVELLNIMKKKHNFSIILWLYIIKSKKFMRNFNITL